MSYVHNFPGKLICRHGYRVECLLLESSRGRMLSSRSLAHAAALRPQWHSWEAVDCGTWPPFRTAVPQHRGTTPTCL